jgi:hypothetical protein
MSVENPIERNKRRIAEAQPGETGERPWGEAILEAIAWPVEVGKWLGIFVALYGWLIADSPLWVGPLGILIAVICWCISLMFDTRRDL